MVIPINFLSTKQCILTFFYIFCLGKPLFPTVTIVIVVAFDTRWSLVTVIRQAVSHFIKGWIITDQPGSGSANETGKVE